MTAIEKVAPVWAIKCDDLKCFRVFVPDGRFDSRYENGARGAAKAAGWQVRPFRGKGSRSLPDLCPEHRPATQEGESNG